MGITIPISAHFLIAFLHFFTSCLTLIQPSLTLLSGCFFSLLPPTPESPVSLGAFISPGCFLHKNTPIGRQALLSDTIHCPCMDMKSVLTSTTEFCSAVETAYQCQSQSCEHAKEAGKFGDCSTDVLVRQ